MKIALRPVPALLGAPVFLALVTIDLAHAELGGGVVGLSAFASCDGQYGATSWSCPTSSNEIVNAAVHDQAAGSTSGADAAGAGNSANASAYATYGRVGASAAASANSRAPLGSSSPHVIGTGSASASGEWVDHVTFNNAALTGTKGSFTASIGLSGGLGAASTGSYIGQASADTFSSSVFFRVQAYDAKGINLLARAVAQADDYVDSKTGYVYRGDSFPKTLTLTVPFVWGTPVELSMLLNVSAYARVNAPTLSPSDPYFAYPRSGDAYANFSHTATWDGISNVLDANGQAVTAWSLSSTSGVNYQQSFAASVPEPGTWSMLVAGGWLLRSFARRRRL